MKTLLKLFINTLAIMVVAYLLPGVMIQGTFEAFVMAIVLALLNSLVKPILAILTLPITVVTLGLFLWVLNGLMILLADALIDGVAVRSLGTAMIFSLLIGILNWIMGAKEIR